jgi:PII-like signaling protein
VKVPVFVLAFSLLAELEIAMNRRILKQYKDDSWVRLLDTKAQDKIDYRRGKLEGENLTLPMIELADLWHKATVLRGILGAGRDFEAELDKVVKLRNDVDHVKDMVRRDTDLKQFVEHLETTEVDLQEASIACECARLEFGDGEEEQYKLLGDLYQYLDHKLKRTPQPCCIKIRLHVPLNPTSFAGAVQCLRKVLSRFNYKAEETREETTEADVTIEPLTPESERIPFRYIDGRVHDVRDSGWVSAQSLFRTNARDDDEGAAMYRAGVDFEGDEYARIFITWERNSADLDPYARIQSKIKKKKYQTKAGDGLLGRIIFLESQWNMEYFDAERLRQILDHELANSTNTIAIVIAERCANVHYRRYYRYVISRLGSSFVSNKVLFEFFPRFVTYDRDFDPILNQKYRRTWEEGAERVKQHEAEWEETNRRRESSL